MRLGFEFKRIEATYSEQKDVEMLARMRLKEVRKAPIFDCVADK
jgi:hypothetical protein